MNPPHSSPSQPRNLRETEVLVTPRFRVVEVESEFASGNVQTKAVVRHPGAVLILPLLDDEHVCLIENYRPAVGKPLLELPAGTREPSESVEETAHRELIEETGYRAGNLESLLQFYVSPGILDERMSAFVATDLSTGPADRQPDESIRNRIASWSEIRTWLQDGSIQDSKTIATLCYWMSFGGSNC